MNVLQQIESHLKKEFDFSIEEKAINGIQIENDGHIEHIYSAVDFSLELLKKTNAKNSLFLVHHGLFWGSQFPIKERYYEILNLMIKNNHALIALHLPLDFHSTKGNNILLAEHFGLKNITSFGDYLGHKPFLKGDISPCSYEDFLHKVSLEFPPLRALHHGASDIRTIGLCTGGGLSGLIEAKKEGCDTFITGDANHIYYHLSKELNINLLSLGHYNSEILGIKHLGLELADIFKIPNTFIDIPTHL